MPNRRMPSGVPNVHRGGFSEAIQRDLERVNLPEKVKCMTCSKWRLVTSFSKRQLALVRNAVVELGPGALKFGHGSCLNCTNGQITELTCLVCDKTKPLIDFANNQRKEHENARCLSCVQGHADAEPVVDENKLLTESDYSTTQGALTASHTASFSGSTRRFTSSEASALNSYTTADENLSLGGNSYIEPERQDAASSRNHQQLGLNDARSVHSDWQSWGVTASRAPSTAATDDKPRKFAKIPAYKPESTQDPNVPARSPEVAKKEVHDEVYDNDDNEPWVL
ncbi:Stc1 domain-containing protein [Aspergillus pseudoustus]|uniref:Stc1 domain-containing protein n=1 Tax=Aspergillus pseudoustus TaxID=1810923 RepID=A0ABR4KL53_9EURO